LDEQIAAAEISAKSAAATIKTFRAEQNRIEVLRSEKNATSFLQSWAEMTRAMPDGAWLTDFSLDAGTVTATGFAMSAASLIEQVRGSGYFTRAEFTAPVVKSPGYDGERFTLKTRIVGR
jgi:general secretion pathway protein L